jgi:hypothetical protein
MNAKLIINRLSGSGPVKPGDKFWAQIEVSGRQTATMAGKRIELDVDAKARESIVNRFAAMAHDPGFSGLLVDADHLSHDLNHRTEALSWLYEVEERDGQLWGLLEATGVGAPAIANKDYRFFSSEYEEEDLEEIEPGIYRPLSLAGLAYTNRPRRKGGKPISNRRQAGTDDENQNENDNDDMKNIAEKLGLPEDATEEDIVGAIEGLQKRVNDAATKEVEGEADAIMNRFGDRIPEKAQAHWRGELIANREEADRQKVVALMEDSFPEKPAADDAAGTIENRDGGAQDLEKKNPKGESEEPPKRLFNRGDAKTPPPVEADGMVVNREAEARAARISNRAGELMKSGQAVNQIDAYRRAEEELDREEKANR